MVELTVTDAPNPADRDVLLKGILAAGESAAGPAEFRPIAILLRSEDGARVEGGLWGRTSWRWMFVELIFVPERWRGGGLGTRLMQAAEQEALRRNCRGIWLDTFSFQARPFYEKLGYSLFGEIADYPPGHNRYFMRKLIAA